MYLRVLQLGLEILKLRHGLDPALCLADLRRR
jgi:hypothetical protein